MRPIFWLGRHFSHLRHFSSHPVRIKLNVYNRVSIVFWHCTKRRRTDSMLSVTCHMHIHNTLGIIVSHQYTVMGGPPKYQQGAPPHEDCLSESLPGAPSPPGCQSSIWGRPARCTYQWRSWRWPRPSILQRAELWQRGPGCWSQSRGLCSPNLTGQRRPVCWLLFVLLTETEQEN